jgi:hypothetical protein
MTILDIATLKVNLDRLEYLKDKYGLDEDYTFNKIFEDIENIYNKADKEAREALEKIKNRAERNLFYK